MISYNKVCELEDFTNPDIKDAILKVFGHERERFGPNFPKGQEYRKYWEIGMAQRTFQDTGILHPNADILGVGAGNEPTVFYLTNHVHRVFATDLYLGAHWGESANPGMMIHPERYWPVDWNPRRLVVQHMNALELQYDDNSFEGIFSSSSLEHFGTHEDVRKSLQEMYRVLKPGGVLSLSTEYRLAGTGAGIPGALLFDEAQVREILIGVANWEPISELNFHVSPATRKTAISYQKAVECLAAHVGVEREIIFQRLVWSQYPHIVLREGDYEWTSIHVALRKPR